MASERLIAQRTRRPKQTVDKEDSTTSDLSCHMLVIGAPIIRRQIQSCLCRPMLRSSITTILGKPELGPLLSVSLMD
jgi:hypothetical protein